MGTAQALAIMANGEDSNDDDEGGADDDMVLMMGVLVKFQNLPSPSSQTPSTPQNGVSLHWMSSSRHTSEKFEEPTQVPVYSSFFAAGLFVPSRSKPEIVNPKPYRLSQVLKAPRSPPAPKA